MKPFHVMKVSSGGHVLEGGCVATTADLHQIEPGILLVSVQLSAEGSRLAKLEHIRIAVHIATVDINDAGFSWENWYKHEDAQQDEAALKLMCSTYWSPDQGSSLVEGMEEIMSSRGINVTDLVQLDEQSGGIGVSRGMKRSIAGGSTAASRRKLRRRRGQAQA